MKKRWEEPQILVQQFVANEYVAACGDSGVVYNFECNAGKQNSSYNVYLEDGRPYATSGRDSGGCIKDYGGYTPCGDKHQADSNSVFLKGYMYEQGFFGGNTGRRIDVIIWTNNYTDVHCTENLNMSTWETAKS